MKTSALNIYFKQALFAVGIILFSISNGIVIERHFSATDPVKYESDIDLFYTKIGLLEIGSPEFTAFFKKFKRDYEAQKTLPIALKCVLLDCSWVLGSKSNLSLTADDLNLAYLKDDFTLVPYQHSFARRSNAEEVSLALKEVYLHPTEDLAIARLSFPVLTFNPLMRANTSRNTNSTYYFYSRYLSYELSSRKLDTVIDAMFGRPFFSWPMKLKEGQECSCEYEWKTDFGFDFPYKFLMSTQDLGFPILQEVSKEESSVDYKLFGILTQQNNKGRVLSLSDKMSNGGTLNQWITNKMIESALQDNVVQQISTNNNTSSQIYHSSNVLERLTPEQKTQFSKFHESSLKKVSKVNYIPYVLLGSPLTLVAPDVVLTYKESLASDKLNRLYRKNHANQHSVPPIHADLRPGNKYSSFTGAGENSLFVTHLEQPITDIPSFCRYRGPVEKENYYLIAKDEYIYLGAPKDGVNYRYAGPQGDDLDRGSAAPLLRDQELSDSITQFKFQYNSVHRFVSQYAYTGLSASTTPKRDPLGLQVIKVVSDGKKLEDYKFVGIVTGWDHASQKLSVTDCTRPELSNKLDNLIISLALSPSSTL